MARRRLGYHTFLILGLLASECRGAASRSPTLEFDVEPILTRLGCNAGACHGRQRGQNGFQLSLLGFDPEYDLDAMVREGRGRRIFPAAPEQSLLLLKATARLPHGGGKRLDPTSQAYAILRDWIASGTPRDPASAPRLLKITVDPTERSLAPNAEFSLKVTAWFSNGRTEDVTPLSAFQSNESAIAAVDADGRIKTGAIPGEAAVTARFRGQFATCTITLPSPGSVPSDHYDRLPRKNFIDGLVWEKLKKLGITPSGPASDATFLRRASLDAIGRLPTVEEARSFLADCSPDRRERLVRRLLERPEYADHWATKWMDLLRPNPYRVGIKAVFNFDAWVRETFRRNAPYDQFVRQVVTARGSTWRPGAATVFRDRREPEELATITSQLFLGIRLECAKCHHHPFEVWSQDDFYQFAAFFARVGRKGTGLSPPISGGEEIMFHATSGEVKHPQSGRVLPPKPLFGELARADAEADRREALARWMTAPENPYFSRVIVNRVWADLMGRGIVEPVDDLRATNPPSNGPLLEALADDFRRSGFDLKHLISTIMSSYVYALGSVPGDRNVADTRNYSRHYRQRLGAEVLLNAVSDVTGVPERFSAAPAGTRADGLWTVRTESLFLDTFGRPDPNQDPPCERLPEGSVVQALHLMNAPGLHAKVTSDDGLPALLAASKKSADQIADELYLRVYARFPADEERSLVAEILGEPKDARARQAAIEDLLWAFKEERTTADEILGKAKDTRARRTAIEDLLWALMNTPEFLFKD